MTTLWWGAINPSAAITNNAAEGDIFIVISTREQRRKNSAGGWDVIVPPDTRGDSVPWGVSHQVVGTTIMPTEPGGFNDRLAVIGASGRPWQLGWTNAAVGIVGPPAESSPTGTEGRHEQNSPLQEWEINHKLGATVVDVTVSAVDGTILVPEIEYIDEMLCRLHFIEPVSGVAVVRR